MDVGSQYIVVFFVVVIVFLLLNVVLKRKTLSSFVMALFVSMLALLLIGLGDNTNSIYGSYLLSMIYSTVVIIIVLIYMTIKVFQDRRTD